MNTTIKTQLSHRTIRAFTDQKIDPQILGTLLEVANRTASSTGIQSYSIIRVSDPKKRLQIAEICRQEYVAHVPELLIFIVDVYRNARIAKAQGVISKNRGDMDRFFQGFTDAAIACQNLNVAAESLGMGAVYFGSILNDPQQIIELLEMPELTFPVVGLGFGYPAQAPQQKPRLDLRLKVFENSYHIFEDYAQEIKDYDEIMKTYYDLREAHKRVDSFSQQVVTRLENSIDKRAALLNVVQQQGFDLRLEK